MLKKVLISTLSLALSACATTPPSSYTFSNSRSYSESYDKVWENIVGFLASHNLQIKNIAKDSGVIYAEAVRFDDSVADCGNTSIFTVRDQHANFNIFVRKLDNKVNVSVNTEFNAIAQSPLDSAAYHPLNCNSKGVLESKILSAAAGTI